MPVLAASFERKGLIPTPVGLNDLRVATPSRTTSRNISWVEAAVFKDRYKLPSRCNQEHEVQKKRRAHRGRIGFAECPFQSDESEKYATIVKLLQCDTCVKTEILQNMLQYIVISSYLKALTSETIQFERSFPLNPST